MPPAPAIVRFEGTTTALLEGVEIVIGRSSAAQVIIGATPLDTRVSRRHVALSVHDGRVTVTRLSTTQPVLVETVAGTVVLEAPGDAITRSGAFELLIPRTPVTDEAGEAFHRFAVQVGAATLPSRAPDGEVGGLAQASTSPLPSLSPRERALLAAYATPLIVPRAGGRRSAASHQEVAAGLNYSYEWTRERIDRLRRRLIAEGWPVGADKDALCRWAVSVHLVTPADSVNYPMGGGLPDSP